MKRGSINYRLYVKYNRDNPAKVRALEDLLSKGYNGLADGVVSKWMERTLEGVMENKEKVRVNGNGVSYFI